MTRYKLFGEIFFYKVEYIFINCYFLRNYQIFISFSELFNFKFISDPEMPGSGKIFPDPYIPVYLQFKNNWWIYRAVAISRVDLVLEKP
jgi:hypothetical protein